MTNLVFIKDDLKKFVVRISSEGFINCCLKHNASPSRIAKLNNCYSTPKEGELVVFEIYNTLLYQIKPNENFKSVCEKFNLQQEELFRVNQTQEFYPWQIVEIPKK